MIALKINEGFLQCYRQRIAPITQSNVTVVKRALLEDRLDGVHISHYHGYVGNSIEVLRELPNLRALFLQEPELFDFAPVQELDQLKMLVLGARKMPVDFGRFPQLTILSTDWLAKDKFPAEFAHLELLRLDAYKPKSKDLSALPLAPNLTKLEFVHGNLETLNGIDRYPELNDVDLAYCTKLQSVSALQRTCIERIHLENCKKINDLDSLAGCAKLKSIRMSRSAELKTLDFLKNFPVLEEFRFVRIDVLDGDMTPLLKLKSVGFSNKRHFSHTFEEVQAVIAGSSL